MAAPSRLTSLVRAKNAPAAVAGAVVTVVHAVNTVVAAVAAETAADAINPKISQSVVRLRRTTLFLWHMGKFATASTENKLLHNAGCPLYCASFFNRN